MKTLAKAVMATTLAMAGAQAMAADVGNGFDVSMNAGLVSNYVWRGISQSKGTGAIQGGLDVKHESGLYAGTWLSSVDFTAYPEANAEQDLYAGYGFNIADVAIDLRYTDYTYIGGNGLNFAETHAAATWKGATVGVDYSSNTPVAGKNSNDNTLNTYVGYSTTIPALADIGVAATVGKYDLRNHNALGDESNYKYWSAGVTKALLGLTWGVTYSDTNLGTSDCAAFAGNQNYCGSDVILSVTKSL